MNALYSIFNHHLNPNHSEVGTWETLKQAVANPKYFESEFTGAVDKNGEKVTHKNGLRCFSATDCQTKTNGGIDQHNQMHFLRVDSDDGTYSVKELTMALVNLGFNSFVIHSSWRHKPHHPKLKCLIPLEIPFNVDIWQNLQERVTEQLGTDPCMNKRGQISYEPATYKGAEYLHHIQDAGAHDFGRLPMLAPLPVAPIREKAAFNDDEHSIIELLQ